MTHDEVGAPPSGARQDDPVEALREDIERIRRDMGGIDRIERLHSDGRLTVREHIDSLVDAGSFRELGTLAASLDPAQRATTPGDGKIAGHATLDGRPVAVAGDDITVRRGSSSVVGSRKVGRLFEQALEIGEPFVYLGQTGGARIPDALGAEGLAMVPPPLAIAARRHRIPVATAIVGESFGGSSFIAGLSDFVVQTAGSCLAVTSPNVIAVATGEEISQEDLGGTAVHSRRTGQVDRTATTIDEANDAIRSFLSYLPSNAWSPPPRTVASAVTPSERPAHIVPTDRRKSYDVRNLIAEVVDGESFFELGPDFARSMVTGLARINGHSVGIIANQPKSAAGTISPDGCQKAIRLLVLCDSFDIPVVSFQDTPGFMVGTKVEHDRLLDSSMRFLQAWALCGAPKLTVVVRKAFGMAFFSMGGSQMGSDVLVAWPGAEIGFMDPAVAANVVGQHVNPADNSPYRLAEAMLIDNIIDPAQTGPTLRDALDRLSSRELRPLDARPLATWPSS